MTLARSYSRALAYFREDLSKIVLSLTLIGVSTTLGLLQPFPWAILIGSILLKSGQDRSKHWVHELFFRIAPEGNVVAQIILLASAALLLGVIQSLLNMAQTLLKINIGYNGLMRVRCDLFRKLQQLSLSYHRSKPQGDAIYRLSYDTAGFQNALNVITGLLINSITLVVMAWIMFSMNWKLALLALSIAPPLMLTIKYFGKRLKERSLNAKEVDTKLTTAIQRSVAAIGLVQAFGREDDEYSRFQNTVRNSANAWNVTQPVLGLIDEVAESAEFYPVPATKAAAKGRPAAEAVPAEPARAPRPVKMGHPTTDLDLDEEGTPSII